jgi:hypothetical protein
MQKRGAFVPQKLLLVFASNLILCTSMAAGQFGKPTCYKTPGISGAVVAGDFNNDNILDLAATSVDHNTVSILLGNGDGTFRKGGKFGIGSGSFPYRMATGDFNHDGNLDLLTVNLTSGNLSVLLGKGDGTFRKAENFVAGGGPSGVVVGDFNEDGKLDLAVSDQSTTKINILLGNGDGTFQMLHGYDTELGPVSLTEGDFNNDGNLDLVSVSATTGDASLLLGNGDGTFQSAKNFGANYIDPVWVTAGDLNGDKNLDLVVVDFTSTVSVFLGNGNGSFRKPKDYAAGRSGDYLLQASLDDFNGDGVLDLAVSDSGDQDGAGAALSLLLGNSNGTFRHVKEFHAGKFPGYIATGRFTSGSFPDVAITGARGVCVLLNTDTGMREGIPGR